MEMSLLQDETFWERIYYCTKRDAGQTMKLTIKQLKQIIKEQVEEATFGYAEGEDENDGKSGETLEDLLNKLITASGMAVGMEGYPCDGSEPELAPFKTKILDYVQRQIDYARNR